MKTQIQIKKEETVKVWGLLILLLMPSCNYYVNGILQYGFNYPSVSALPYVIMAIVGLWAYTLLFKKRAINSNVEAIIIFLALGTFISYVIYPELRKMFITKDYNPLNSQAIALFLYGVPTMIIASVLVDWQRFFRLLSYFSMALIPMALLSYWYTINSLSIFEIDYMALSYNIVLSICASSAFGYTERLWYPFIISFVGIAFVFLCGSRGAFLCSALCFLFFLYKRIGNKGSKQRIVLLVLLVVFVGSYIQSFLSTSEEIIDMGYASGRTVYKMEGGGFFLSHGRDDINRIVDAAILDNPFGYGLFGDRYAMVKGGLTPLYCHNIIREFVCSFGVIIGPVLLLLIFLKIYKAHKRILNPMALVTMYVILPIGLVKLLMSDSFLLNFPFWALVGIILNKHILFYNRIIQ